MNFFFEIHKNILREEPGDDKATKRVFNMLTGLEGDIKLLDIGCGFGSHTLELAKNNNKICIEAIEERELFIDKLKECARNNSLGDRIQCKNSSICDIKSIFNEEYFDIIWSEKSRRDIEFKKVLIEWGDMLKRDGYMVIKEISWLKSRVPEELKEFLQGKYREINRVDQNILNIEESGYRMLGSFTLPEAICWENYYEKVEKAIEELGGGSNSYSENSLNELLREIEIFKKYKEYYGYVFYIMQK